MTNYHHAELRPAAARLRPRQARGRDRRPARARRRGGAGAERQDLPARPVDDGDRRRRAACTTSAGSWAASIRGVTEATTDILIECAYFDPEHIALTGQKLGLTSDARSRFERGVDPAFLEAGPASWRPRWRSSWPAASRREVGPRRRRRRARPRPSPTTRRAAPALGRRRRARGPAAARSSQRLGFTVDARRHLADRGAVMASRRRRRGRHRRGGRPHRGHRQGARRRRCRARPASPGRPRRPSS